MSFDAKHLNVAFFRSGRCYLVRTPFTFLPPQRKAAEKISTFSFSQHAVATIMCAKSPSILIKVAHQIVNAKKPNYSDWRRPPCIFTLVAQLSCCLLPPCFSSHQLERRAQFRATKCSFCVFVRLFTCVCYSLELQPVGQLQGCVFKSSSLVHPLGLQTALSSTAGSGHIRPMMHSPSNGAEREGQH